MAPKVEFNQTLAGPSGNPPLPQAESQVLNQFLMHYQARSDLKLLVLTEIIRGPDITGGTHL